MIILFQIWFFSSIFFLFVTIGCSLFYSKNLINNVIYIADLKGMLPYFSNLEVARLTLLNCSKIQFAWETTKCSFFYHFIPVYNFFFFLSILLLTFSGTETLQKVKEKMEKKNHE